MVDYGELHVTAGRVTDIQAFMDIVASQWFDYDFVLMVADRYRKEECTTAMEKWGLTIPVEWRGQGHSHTADGSADVRAFQTAVLSGRLKTSRSLMMEAAITNSSLSRDAAGNPKLDRAKSNGRIDALQAAVLSVGAGVRYAQRPKAQGYLGML